MKTISIFGSTGSVGKKTIELIQRVGGYKVQVLSANSNADSVIKQAILLDPKYVLIHNVDVFREVKASLSHTNIKVLCGEEGLYESLHEKVNVVLVSVMGFAGLNITLHAIGKCQNLALVNKESLVSGGFLIQEKIKNSDTKLIPVDSEHNALFQVLSQDNKKVEEVIITSSGGEFWKKSKKELENITPEQAIKHPKWKMGAKISVDSATLMNKVLEIIEARVLFPYIKNIKVVIHPEAVIHALVSYMDGMIHGVMSVNDMSVILANSLEWPNRLNVLSHVRKYKLDLIKLSSLNFYDVDDNRRDVLDLAYDAINYNSSYTTILNSANEAAVKLFLEKKIAFCDIIPIIRNQLPSKQNQIILKSYQDIEDLHNNIYSSTYNVIPHYAS